MPISQNGEVTSWAAIESDAPSRPLENARSSTRDGRSPIQSVRLRRSERLIVGAIDAAAHVFQRRARHIVLGSAVMMVPMVAVHLLLTVLAFDQYERFDSLLGDAGYVGVETGLVMLAVILQSLSAHLVGAYTAAYLVPYQLGGSPRSAVCLGLVLRRSPLLLATWALTHWPTLLIMWWFASLAPADVAALAYIMVPLLVTISAATLLVAPVVMSEHGDVRSIGRAWRLVRPRFGVAFGFVIACGLLGGLLATFIALLPDLAQGTGLITFGSLTWLAQGVATQLAVLLVVPLVAIATAQLYLQFRIQLEGLDIVLAADKAFGAQRA